MKQRIQGNIQVRAVSDFGEVILETMKEVRLGAGGRKEIPLEFGRLDPGFYNVTLMFNSVADN